MKREEKYLVVFGIVITFSLLSFLSQYMRIAYVLLCISLIPLSMVYERIFNKLQKIKKEIIPITIIVSVFLFGAFETYYYKNYGLTISAVIDLCLILGYFIYEWNSYFLHQDWVISIQKHETIIHKRLALEKNKFGQRVGNIIVIYITFWVIDLIYYLVTITNENYIFEPTTQLIFLPITLLCIGIIVYYYNFVRAYKEGLKLFSAKTSISTFENTYNRYLNYYSYESLKFLERLLQNKKDFLRKKQEEIKEIKRLNALRKKKEEDEERKRLQEEAERKREEMKEKSQLLFKMHLQYNRLHIDELLELLHIDTNMKGQFIYHLKEMINSQNLLARYFATTQMLVFTKGLEGYLENLDREFIEWNKSDIKSNKII